MKFGMSRSELDFSASIHAPEAEDQSTVLEALAPFDVTSMDARIKNQVDSMRSEEADLKMRYEAIFDRLKAWANEGLVFEFEVAQRA